MCGEWLSLIKGRYVLQLSLFVILTWASGTPFKLSVCININPHIPAAKILSVFMDQESVYQTSLAADLCEWGSDKHTCCWQYVSLKCFATHAANKVVLVMKLQNTFKYSLAWMSQGQFTCFCYLGDLIRSQGFTKERWNTVQSGSPSSLRKGECDAAGLQRYSHIVR